MFEYFANDTKFRSTFPTSFQLTTARHAMTFATNLHIICNSLKNTERNRLWKTMLGALSIELRCLTIRPTLLLCKLILDWISPAFSMESKNSSENSMPKFMLCEQPPHFQRLVAFNLIKMVCINEIIKLRKKELQFYGNYRGALFCGAKFLGESMMRLSMVWKKCCRSNSKCLRSDFGIPFRLLCGSHPHEIKRPWLHARAMLNVTPAAEMA